MTEVGGAECVRQPSTGSGKTLFNCSTTGNSTTHSEINVKKDEKTFLNALKLGRAIQKKKGGRAGKKLRSRSLPDVQRKEATG